MAFGFYRSIWITLRAANYTSQAFRDATRSMGKMERAQERLRISAGKNMMQIGMMYIAMAGIATQTMLGIVRTSRRGTRMLERFGRRTSKSLSRLGDALADLLSQILPIIEAMMKFITAHPIITKLAAGFILFATAVLFAGGVLKVFKGALIMFKLEGILASLSLKKMALTTLDKWIPASQAGTAATMTFASAIGLVTAGFVIFLAIGQLIGSRAGAIVAALSAITFAVLALAIALNILSLGALTAKQLGALAAGAGMASGVMAIQTAKEYQMGTSFVRQGGLAVVHAGEEIRSARESPPPSRAERREAIAQKSEFFIPVTIENVHTKADKDTMYREFKRAIKDAIDEKA